MFRVLALLTFLSTPWGYCPVASGGIPIAITVDDLPVFGSEVPGVTRVEIVRKFVETIQRHGSPPVYGFFNAGKMDASPDAAAALKLWLDSGFKLANHTYSHQDLNLVTDTRYIEEIAANEEYLRALPGLSDFHFFRYPWLHEGETLEKRNAVRSYLDQKGYKLAHVTLDSADWAYAAAYERCATAGQDLDILWMQTEFLRTGPEQLEFSRQLSHLLFGRDISQILLLHIGAFDMDILDRYLTNLENFGAEWVSLEQALRDPAYEEDSGYVSDVAKTFLGQLVLKRGLLAPPRPSIPFEKLEAVCR